MVNSGFLTEDMIMAASKAVAEQGGQAARAVPAVSLGRWRCLVLGLSLILALLHEAGSVQFEGSLAQYKENDLCDVWAKTDGECVNNPRFMWSACLGSCLTYAKDVEDECGRWKEEGECTNNPVYIQVRPTANHQLLRVI